jgi:hypothetical protein
VAVEETFKAGKDVLGWDQSQARTWDAVCRQTALSALAQLRQVAVRNALEGLTQLPEVTAGDAPAAAGGAVTDEPDKPDDADLQIPRGDAPVPDHGGQPRPRDLGLIKLSVAETARLERLARDYAAGLFTRTRLAFALSWSARGAGTRPPPAGTTTTPGCWPPRLTPADGRR